MLSLKEAVRCDSVQSDGCPTPLILIILFSTSGFDILINSLFQIKQYCEHESIIVIDSSLLNLLKIATIVLYVCFQFQSYLFF